MTDYYLDNQNGAAFRSELNAIIAAIRANDANSSPPTALPGQQWFETDKNTLWLRNAGGVWAKVYTSDQKPTKADVGLNSVPNYSATSSLTDGSSSKFALAAATKNLQDNKLDKKSTAANSAKLNNQSASYYATAAHTHTLDKLGAAPKKHSHSEADLPNASTTGQGVVQLSNNTNGSSQTLAATELAVRNAKEEAASKGVPPGFIGMFAGTEKQIPSGWQLCNGQGKTSNGIQIPNLIDRFIIGAGKTYDVGSTGGSTTAKTSASGSHAHGVSVGNTTLSQSQTPNHFHLTVKRQRVGAGSYWDNLTPANSVASVGDTAEWSESYTLMAGGGVPDVGKTSNAGNSGSHNHSGSCNSAGNHDHSVSTMSPYYALCYVIKL